MRFQARLHRGSEVLEREVELATNEHRNGWRCIRISDQVTEADCEEITPGVYSLLLNGKSYLASVAEVEATGGSYAINVGVRRIVVELRDVRKWRRTGSSFESEGPLEVVAPMPGKVVRVLVQEKQEVSAGQGLLVIEAMKMQNELRAPRAGRVVQVYAAEGQGVDTGARLMRLG